MILLVRHGETEWNVARRFQGRQDSPLTELGRRQAEAMAGLVCDLVRRDPTPEWRLVASPLGRTVATAAAIARATGLETELDPRLAEVDCGDWEGRSWPEVVAEHPAGLPARQILFSSPGGETYDAVLERIESFMSDLPPEPQRRIIVVSHGGSGRLIRGAYARLPGHEILTLESPHAAVWRLANGQIDRFDCGPVD